MYARSTSFEKEGSFFLCSVSFLSANRASGGHESVTVLQSIHSKPKCDSFCTWSPRSNLVWSSLINHSRCCEKCFWHPWPNFTHYSLLRMPSEGASLCVNNAWFAKPAIVHPKTIFRLALSKKSMPAFFRFRMRQYWYETVELVCHTVSVQMAMYHYYCNHSSELSQYCCWQRICAKS